MSKHQTQRERVSVRVCGDGGGRRSSRGHGEEKLFWRRPDLTETQPSVTNTPVLEGEKTSGCAFVENILQFLSVPGVLCRSWGVRVLGFDEAAARDGSSKCHRAAEGVEGGSEAAAGVLQD